MRVSLTAAGAGLSSDHSLACHAPRAGRACPFRQEPPFLSLDSRPPSEGWECKVLEGSLHRGTLGRSLSPNLQAIVAESAPDWLYSQCCRPSYLLHLMLTAFRSPTSRPASGAEAMNVACTEKFGSESTCIARPTAPTADERLPFEKPEVPPNRQRVLTLRRKIAQCRREQAAIASRWGALQVPPLDLHPKSNE